MGIIISWAIALLEYIFSGARKPAGLADVYGHSVESYAGVHHAGSLYSNRVSNVRRDAQVE